MHHLNLDVDLDLFTDQHAAGFERLIPGQAPLAAQDRGVGAEAEAVVAPGIFAAAGLLDVERHRMSRAANREVPRHAITISADALDASALEDHLRELFSVEEI